ncbi:MAG: winged helix-turn-helix domain-containing protein [Acidobacteria bacterium]|nr:winged helix-turn-helix domain-containing protein [Acidobacteriota bacterium]MBS1866772.1 winged helix-turn-helix domain-containing protein [Acidobacteriota bacterium]
MSTEMTGMQSLVAKRFAEAKSEPTEKSQPRKRYLNFGNFTVDLKREELFKDGTRVKLPGKVYQTLLALLDRPGEVVSRGDLRVRLWPEGTHVNYDANVNTTVNKLRLALGDSPEKPMYVETIPRQGYSFVGQVLAAEANLATRNGNGHSVEVALTNAPDVTETQIADSQTSKPSTWFFAGVVSLVLAGMLFGAAMILYLHRAA